MKKKLLSILAICFVVFSIFTLAGCAVTLTGGPAKSDSISGNGSLSVRKGDYLYYEALYPETSDQQLRPKIPQRNYRASPW